MLAWPVAAGKADRMAQEQFLKADGLGVCFWSKSKRASTEAAHGAWRNFKRPNAFVVYSKLRVNRTVRQSQRADGIRRAFLNLALL